VVVTKRDTTTSIPAEFLMVRNTKGFTLVELLIVTVIIGVLASIAIPSFGSTKEKAYIASMKSDLRNLATAQEAYYSEHNAHKAGSATNVGGSTTSGIDNFYASAGNTVVATIAGNGWSATAANSGSTKTCAIFVATTTAVAPAVVEGEPKCD
jgi:prepilin-type N-terminal cleavage/methylation domain-containing protein